MILLILITQLILSKYSLVVAGGRAVFFLDPAKLEERRRLA